MFCIGNQSYSFPSNGVAYTQAWRPDWNYRYGWNQNLGLGTVVSCGKWRIYLNGAVWGVPRDTVGFLGPLGELTKVSKAFQSVSRHLRVFQWVSGCFTDFHENIRGFFKSVQDGMFLKSSMCFRGLLWQLWWMVSVSVEFRGIEGKLREFYEVYDWFRGVSVDL